MVVLKLKSKSQNKFHQQILRNRKCLTNRRLSQCPSAHRSYPWLNLISLAASSLRRNKNLIETEVQFHLIDQKQIRIALRCTWRHKRTLIVMRLKEYEHDMIKQIKKRSVSLSRSDSPMSILVRRSHRGCPLETITYRRLLTFPATTRYHQAVFGTSLQHRSQQRLASQRATPLRHHKNRTLNA